MSHGGTPLPHEGPSRGTAAATPPAWRRLGGHHRKARPRTDPWSQRGVACRPRRASTAWSAEQGGVHRHSGRRARGGALAGPRLPPRTGWVCARADSCPSSSSGGRHPRGGQRRERQREEEARGAGGRAGGRASAQGAHGPGGPTGVEASQPEGRRGRPRAQVRTLAPRGTPAGSSTWQDAAASSVSHGGSCRPGCRGARCAVVHLRGVRVPRTHVDSPCRACHRHSRALRVVTRWPHVCSTYLVVCPARRAVTAVMACPPGRLGDRTVRLPLPRPLSRPALPLGL